MIPAAIAATVPLLLMDPIAGALLDHAPPAGKDASVDVCPTHAERIPAIFDGAGLMVTGIVATHPALE